MKNIDFRFLKTCQFLQIWTVKCLIIIIKHFRINIGFVCGNVFLFFCLFRINLTFLSTPPLLLLFIKYFPNGLTGMKFEMEIVCTINWCIGFYRLKTIDRQDTHSVWHSKANANKSPFCTLFLRSKGSDNCQIHGRKRERERERKGV